jgi:hypothetical protein
MDRDPGPDEQRTTASSSYALGRLWRAIETATTHADPAIRTRAEEKALAWEAVLNGMASGTLNVGSRTPVANTPAWVTLEVAHGGFATGRYVAEGPLQADELSLLERLPSSADGATDRMRLNTWYLSDEGLGQLGEALRDGNFVVEVPEHGALAVVAWLVENGHEAFALDLVSELYPLLDRLRFYPRMTERTPTSGAVVHLRTVEDVTKQLRDVSVPDQVAAMNEALEVWRPLLDRLVALWLQTVADDWPCATWPADWREQRHGWLADYERAAAEHELCGQHRKASSNFAILCVALEQCEFDSSALTGREVGRIRMALKRSIERWGEPGSAELEAVRATQRAWAARPTHMQVALGVAERLSPLPADSGIADLEAALEPVDVDQTEGAPTPVPYALARKVERALEAPIEELVERGVIPSSEVLAQVLPQISSHVASGAFQDPTLRELYARVYAAFRRRRSLLLLNLEHQVQIEELPWVQALSTFRTATSDARGRAQDTLRHTTLLALTSFPQTILPNPLVREMAALAKQADLGIPFVEEIAADIFMGTFTTKWRRAAAVASEVMDGTLYARYYDLPDPALWATRPDDVGLIERVRVRWGKPTAEDFAQLCSERAREAAAGDGSFVARNGAVIEQSQILTTHNLAQLVDRLDLHDRVQQRAAELAVETFEWIVRQQNMRWDSRHSQLQMLKNTAYAWRQAIFYLSLADEREQNEALAALRAAVVRQPDEWQQRFEPAVSGLDAVAGGARFGPLGKHHSGRRFLGWSIGPHWLSSPARDSGSSRD